MSPLIYYKYLLLYCSETIFLTKPIPNLKPLNPYDGTFITNLFCIALRIPIVLCLCISLVKCLFIETIHKTLKRCDAMHSDLNFMQIIEVWKLNYAKRRIRRLKRIITEYVTKLI